MINPKLEYLLDVYLDYPDNVSEEHKEWLLDQLVHRYFAAQEVIDAAVALPPKAKSIELQEALDQLYLVEFDSEEDEAY